MRGLLMLATTAILTVAMNAPSQAALKEVPYPAVNVELAESYFPDAAFGRMRSALADAVAKKDAQAVFGLVGPTFVWLSRGAISHQLDFGRDALHNFKVIFGFREFGKDIDLPTVDSPTWDSLAAFVNDQNFYFATSTLVCGRMAATIADEAGFERARQRIGPDESIEWYFAVTDTPATATPAGTGTPVGRAAGKTALPVLRAFPAIPEGQSGPPTTHLQVLLPSGKPGWIPISALRPLVTDRLCYALTPAGDWKIAAFDDAQ